MTYTPAAGDRVIVHRTSTRSGKSDSMTGVIVHSGDAEGGRPIHFEWSGRGRFHLATPEELARLGCTQTIELISSAKAPQ